MAADVIAESIKNGDVSEKALSKFNKLWWEERGGPLRNVEKLREVLEKLSDDASVEIQSVFGLHREGFVYQGKGFVKHTQLTVGYALFKVSAAAIRIQCDGFLEIFDGGTIIAVGGTKRALVKPVVGIFFGGCGLARRCRS